VEEKENVRTLKDLKEATKRAKIVIADMRKNRKDYGALDLAWRNIDINMIVVECVNDLLELLSRKKKKEDIVSSEAVVDSHDRHNHTIEAQGAIPHDHHSHTTEVQGALPLRGGSDEAVDKSSGRRVGNSGKRKK